MSLTLSRLRPLAYGQAWILARHGRHGRVA
jgi:hypothetical protein